MTQEPDRPDNAERFLAYVRLYFPHILEVTFTEGRKSPKGFDGTASAWRTRYPSTAHLGMFRYRAQLGVEQHSLEEVLALTRGGTPGRKIVERHSTELREFFGGGNTIGKRAIEEMCRGLEADEDQTKTLLAFAGTKGSKPLSEQRTNEIYDELIAARRPRTEEGVADTTDPIPTSDSLDRPDHPNLLPPGWQTYAESSHQPPIPNAPPAQWEPTIQVEQQPNGLAYQRRLVLSAAASLLVIALVVLIGGMSRPSEIQGQAFPESVKDEKTLEFTVEPYAQGSCGAYVFPGVQDPADLGSPPSYSENFGKWLDRHGGVSTAWPAGSLGSGLVHVTLQAPTTKKVVVTGVRAEVTERGGPADGAIIKNPCGSDTPGRAVRFDGDTQPPRVVASTDGFVEINGVDVKTEQLTLPIQVSADEPETLYVTMTTAGSVAWKLHLDWSMGMERGTTTLDNNGQPFRTAATVAGAAAYIFTDAGWIPK